MKLLSLLCCVTILMGFSKIPLGVHTQCKTPGLVSFTFDDGVSNSNTDKILDILKEHKVKATFFIVGDTLIENKKRMVTLQRIKDEGHVLANHTYTHLNLTRLSESKISQEVLDVQNAINNLYESKPRYTIRPPYGGIDERSYNILTSLGFKVVLWSIDTKDWQSGRSAESILKKYQKIISDADPRKDSFIVLLHERNTSISVLGEMLRLTKDRGFSVVDINSCITS